MTDLTVDLPVTTARIHYDDGPPDAFVDYLADETGADEIVLVVTGGATHIYPVNWNFGPDDTVQLPDPPDGYTLTDARYVVVAYREASTGGTTPSFGFNPEPDNAPYLLANTSSFFVIDYLPIGGYAGVVVGRSSEDLGLLATGAPGNFGGDAWTVNNIVGTTAGIIHITYMALRLFYTPDTTIIEFPCDIDIELDLSTAVFLANSGTLSGQYVDGVICSTDDFLYPDFYFPGVTFDPDGRYRITVTYDSGSIHNLGAGREVYVAGVRPDLEQTDVDAAFGAGGEYSGEVAVWWDTGLSTSGDIQTFTVGTGRGPGPIAADFPGLPTWDDGSLGVAAGYTRPWFETEAGGAVSAITIRKVCKTVPPPLRQYPRTDGRGASSTRRAWPIPNTIQASNRRGPNAIL